MPQDRGDEPRHGLPVIAGGDVGTERIDPVAAEDQQGAVVARACRGNEAEGGDALRERECPASGEVVGLGEDQLRAGRRGPDVPRFERGVVDRHPQPPVAVGHLLAAGNFQRAGLPRRGAVIDDRGVQEILHHEALDRLAHPDAQGGRRAERRERNLFVRAIGRVAGLPRPQPIHPTVDDRDAHAALHPEVACPLHSPRGEGHPSDEVRASVRPTPPVGDVVAPRQGRGAHEVGGDGGVDPRESGGEPLGQPCWRDFSH